MIIYLIRQDQQYHEQNIVSNTTGYPIEETIDTWNKTFNIGWFQFRSLLNDLRERNAKDLKFDARYYLYDFPYAFFNEFPNANLDDCIFVPTDDDDWFHPELFTILRESPKQDHYRWNYAEVVPNNYYTNAPYTCNKLTIYNKKNHPKIWPYYASNNYALHIHSTKCLEMLAYHGTADLAFSRTDANIDKCLSIHPLHLSSISIFCNPSAISYCCRENITSDLLLDMLQIYQKPTVLPDDTPEYFIPFFEELHKIYKSLI